MSLILPGQTIGILGGGQLGKMMAISAKEMGFRVTVLDPNPDSPCGQVADEQIVAAYDDLEAAKKLAEAADVITYEFENVDAQVASYLEKHAYLPQGSHLLEVTSNRLEEKEWAVKAGGQVAPFTAVTDLESLKEAVQTIGYPAVLKTVSGGYDGKGQAVLSTPDDDPTAEDMVAQGGVFILEKFIDYQKEISVIVTRSSSGETAVFPTAENLHQNNVLHQTMAPARIGASQKQAAEDTALRLADTLNLVGTMAVEFFLTQDGEVLVNELAPRPHNSGHYTIEACVTSQFRQHIRGICGWPLSPVDLLKPAVMVNLLGDEMEAALSAIGNMKQAHVHIYGKDGIKPGRKMGHITILDENVEAAQQAAADLGIWTKLKTGETV